jgi:hypothetical protein
MQYKDVSALAETEFCRYFCRQVSLKFSKNDKNTLLLQQVYNRPLTWGGPYSIFALREHKICLIALHP